jgi:hypothetical protein
MLRINEIRTRRLLILFQLRTSRDYLLPRTDLLACSLSSEATTTHNSIPSWRSLSRLSYVTTDGQSASLSWNKAPIWGLRPDFYYRRTVAGLLMWGALSDVRTGLSFTIAAGPCQRSHSLVRSPLDSRPYFTVSDLRLPISSPPTTSRVTVEVYLYTCGTDMALQQTYITWSLSSQSIGASVVSTKKAAPSIVACWTEFTELLPGNASIKSIIISSLVGS